MTNSFRQLAVSGLFNMVPPKPTLQIATDADAKPQAGCTPIDASKPRQAQSRFYVVLTGNPNCGKTTLFNALTGLRAKVANYPGVTVERKEGRLQGVPPEMQVQLLDLPGTYSLSPNSIDEQIARDVLLNRLPELPPPDLIVLVVDAANLQRNLYYATQVIELGYPTIVALNMVDVAEENGHLIDAEKLAGHLGVPVVPVVANTGRGIPELRHRILKMLGETGEISPRLFCQLPGLFRIEAQRLADLLAETFRGRRLQAIAEAFLILSNEKALASSREHYPQKIQDAVTAARARLEAQGVDWRDAPIEWRYARVSEIQRDVTVELAPARETASDKLDRLLTHKVWGSVIFIIIMALMFESIFTIARLPMDALQSCVDFLGMVVGGIIPPGDLNSLLVDGVIAGVGAVVVFLPQILLLFLFIGFLEDTGYMARVAFLMDKIMNKVGLHGKSFIPLLSSFACAIPGIMATRTIESHKDRFVTILVAPLMSCSARLPVYTLLIAACIPPRKVFGFLHLHGLTMLGMYLLGILSALFMAWLFKKTLFKGEPPLLILELPPYKRPLLRVVARHMWERSKLFLQRAGTVILSINILLWFLATYPRTGIGLPPSSSPKQISEQAGSPVQQDHSSGQIGYNEPAGERLRSSFAGQLGHLIEPIIAPLGFDWKIGIGIISSFAAREIFVSTMSTVYNVADSDSGEPGTRPLVKTLQNQKTPDGRPVYSVLTGITLMVFYVFALQCVSTVAVVRRETNSWKWPLFQWLYMGILAWGAAFTVRHIGLMLGLQ